MTIFDIEPASAIYTGVGMASYMDENRFNSLTDGMVYSKAAILRTSYCESSSLELMYRVFNDYNINVNVCPGCDSVLHRPHDDMMITCTCGTRIISSDMIMYGAAVPAIREAQDVI